MSVSRLTKKYQTTVPAEIRKFLNLIEGDKVDFEICNNQVIIRKITPLEIEYLNSLESTLQEWNSKEDDEAYNDL
jgi:AbrB family looped-hinge helix DNA binding protein